MQSNTRYKKKGGSKINRAPNSPRPNPTSQNRNWTSRNPILNSQNLNKTEQSRTGPNRISTNFQ